MSPDIILNIFPCSRTQSASCTTRPPPASCPWSRSLWPLRGSPSPGTSTGPHLSTRRCSSTSPSSSSSSRRSFLSLQRYILRLLVWYIIYITWYKWYIILRPRIKRVELHFTMQQHFMTVEFSTDIFLNVVQMSWSKTRFLHSIKQKKIWVWYLFLQYAKTAKHYVYAPQDIDLNSLVRRCQEMPRY